MNWKKKLTKRELNHIKETTQRPTLTEFKRNLEGQKEGKFPCFECRHIAIKLGINPDDPERKANK